MFVYGAQRAGLNWTWTLAPIVLIRLRLCEPNFDEYRRRCRHSLCDAS